MSAARKLSEIVVFPFVSAIPYRLARLGGSARRNRQQTEGSGASLLSHEGAYVRVRAKDHAGKRGKELVI